jgi:hypothetical protein
MLSGRVKWLNIEALQLQKTTAIWYDVAFSECEKQTKATRTKTKGISKDEEKQSKKNSNSVSFVVGNGHCAAGNKS